MKICRLNKDIAMGYNGITKRFSFNGKKGDLVFVVEIIANANQSLHAKFLAGNIKGYIFTVNRHDFEYLDERDIVELLADDESSKLLEEFKSNELVILDRLSDFAYSHGYLGINYEL